ncbi:MAG: hypothetical protein J6W71_03775, partial [Methanobrevibacter sp.]|nr:hypothetical protein [Methanobrevibacter sp.]
MSSINYDVEKSVSYNNAYRHYIATYSVAFPPYNTYVREPTNRSEAAYQAYISFDEDSETEIQMEYHNYD